MFNFHFDLGAFFRALEDEAAIMQGWLEDDLQNVLRAEAFDPSWNWDPMSYLFDTDPFYFDPFQPDPAAIPF